MKMRAKRDGESAAIATSPQQVLHATEKHIIVDHERSQVHLVSSTPSTQVPVLNSYHILNTAGLLGNDPRSLFSAHLLASIQQLAAATATTNAEGRYQIPLTIQMPSPLYAPPSNIQVATQPPTSTIQMPQQILMSHHDLNMLNNLTESNLNLIQGAQQQQAQQQSQYENLISRLMRGFIETDATSLEGIPSMGVHLMPIQMTTSTGPGVTTTITNSVASNKKEAKVPRKYNHKTKNSNEKMTNESEYKGKSKRDSSTAMVDSTTTTNNSVIAVKNKRNKLTTTNGTGKDNGIIPNMTQNYNHSMFHDISTDFLATPIKASNETTTLKVIPENGKSKKPRKNATSTPKRKKDKDVVDHSKGNSPTHLHSNMNNIIINNNNNNNGRDKVFSCPICNRTFGYKHVLQNHERTHTGEKPFECNICSKKFTRDHHLKTHMRLHTGEKPYQCSHCDRQFVQVANLRRHLRVHTGERPYACDICASKFSDSNQLKAHNLIHKGEKPYNCVECGGKFRRRHHLIHHKCNNNSTSPIKAKMDQAPLTPVVLGKGETICTYIVPALSPPLSSSPVAPATSIHSGGSSSNSSLSSNGGTRINGSTKRERKSRETRRIIRPEGLPKSGSALSPISDSGRKVMQTDTIMVDLSLPEEQTQPQDLSFGNNNTKFTKLQPVQQGPVLQQRHFTGSHSSCSGTSLSSPSPPTSGGSHQEDSIFAHCNSEEEPTEFTSGSSSSGSGDEEHHLSGMTPPTSCSSHGGDHHNLDKVPVVDTEEKMDWRFAQYHSTRDKLKGDA